MGKQMNKLLFYKGSVIVLPLVSIYILITPGS